MCWIFGGGGGGGGGGENPEEGKIALGWAYMFPYPFSYVAFHLSTFLHVWHQKTFHLDSSRSLFFLCWPPGRPFDLS